MELKYTWEIIRTYQNPTIENETVVRFNYIGTDNSGVSWGYNGGKSFATSEITEILEQLPNIEEIEAMQIRIRKEIKKIVNPQYYGIAT
jgi:hypothetical protein